MALTLFRAFSAWILQLPQPGPMAQAITFRAFGAATPSFDTASEALGYFHSVPLRGSEKHFCSKATSANAFRVPEEDCVRQTPLATIIVDLFGHF